MRYCPGEAECGREINGQCQDLHARQARMGVPFKQVGQAVRGSIAQQCLRVDLAGLVVLELKRAFSA